MWEAHFGEARGVVVLGVHGRGSLADSAPGTGVEDLKDTRADGGADDIAAVRQPQGSLLACTLSPRGRGYTSTTYMHVVCCTCMGTQTTHMAVLVHVVSF